MKQTFALIVVFIFKAAGLCATGGAKENVLTWYGMTDADKTLVMQMNCDAYDKGHEHDMMGFYVKLVNSDKGAAELPEAINSVGLIVWTLPSDIHNLYVQAQTVREFVQGKYNDSDPLHHISIKSALLGAIKLIRGNTDDSAITQEDFVTEMAYKLSPFLGEVDPAEQDFSIVYANIHSVLVGSRSFNNSSFAKALEVLQGRPYLKGTKEVHGGIFGSDGNKQSGFDSKKNLYDKLKFLLQKLNARSGRSDTTVSAALNKIGTSSSCDSYKLQVNPSSTTLQAAIETVNGMPPTSYGLLGDIQTTPEGGTSYTAKDIYQRLFKGIENLNALLQSRVQGGWTDQPNIGAIISNLP